VCVAQPQMDKAMVGVGKNPTQLLEASSRLHSEFAKESRSQRPSYLVSVSQRHGPEIKNPSSCSEQLTAVVTTLLG
jgi:hypothetical protein